VLRRDGYRCVDCNATSDLTLDYLVPLQDGGQMTLDNAQTRCRSCNASHGRRRFFESAPPRTLSHLEKP
jgi:5-methylcytosine-specific restriction endonuclease McrA